MQFLLSFLLWQHWSHQVSYGKDSVVSQFQTLVKDEQQKCVKPASNHQLRCAKSRQIYYDCNLRPAWAVEQYTSKQNYAKVLISPVDIGFDCSNYVIYRDRGWSRICFVILHVMWCHFQNALLIHDAIAKHFRHLRRLSVLQYTFRATGLFWNSFCNLFGGKLNSQIRNLLATTVLLSLVARLTGRPATGVWQRVWILTESVCEYMKKQQDRILPLIILQYLVLFQKVNSLHILMRFSLWTSRHLVVHFVPKRDTQPGSLYLKRA